MSGRPGLTETSEVFVVQHSHDLDGCDETKLIGVYRTQSAADAAIARLRKQPGFRERPEAFAVDRYRLDEDHWTEGFITVRS
jgi:homoserine kinase type II